MSFAKRLVLILFILVSCVGCDQTTKSVAHSYLPVAQTRSYFGDTVRLQLTHNAGAFLSLGASLPKSWRLALFSVSASALLLGLLVYCLYAKNIPPAVLVAGAVVFAGGFSNLIDRLMHSGYVLDFINLGIGPLRTGIFNVADICISVGVLILVTTRFRRIDK